MDSFVLKTSHQRLTCGGKVLGVEQAAGIDQLQVCRRVLCLLGHFLKVDGGSLILTNMFEHKGTEQHVPFIPYCSHP